MNSTVSRYVLLACDGLWNAFPDSAHVLEWIDKHLPLAVNVRAVLSMTSCAQAIARVPMASTVSTDPSFVLDSDVWRQRWTWLSDRLCEEAVTRATRDNVSILIIPLGTWFMQM